MDAFHHLVRRSRSSWQMRGHGSSAHARHIDQLEKREYAGGAFVPGQQLSPGQLASSMSTNAGLKTVAAPVAAQPATKGTSISRISTPSAPTSTSPSVSVKPTSSSAITSTSSKPVSSSTLTSSTTLSSSTPTSTSLSTSTTKSPSPSPSPTPSSSTLVLTLTSTTSSSPVPSSPLADAAKAGTSTSSMSTGAIAGIALGVLVGVVVLGSALGWVYKRWINRGYGTKPWSKLDDDITPFSGGEKTPRMDMSDDDFYGGTTAPVIGSSRALNLARQNAFDANGSMRPDSEYMDPMNNRAGFGAGGAAALGQYSAYPEMRSVPYEPYQSQRGGRPQLQLYSDEPPRHSPPHSNSRQLLGPGLNPQHPHAYDPAEHLAPMSMGRPAPPQNEAGLMAMEDYSDMPTPRTATTMGEWAGHAVMPPSMQDAHHFTHDPFASANGFGYDLTAPSSSVHPLPHLPNQSLSTNAQSANLPALPPLSPLMGAFGLPESQRLSQPLPMYESETSEQKRLYGEVARAAGVAEPLTPAFTPGLAPSLSQASHGLHNGPALDRSVSSGTSATYSSFSATEPVPRLPSAQSSSPSPPHVQRHPLPPIPPTVSVQPPPPQPQPQLQLHLPYVHGRPLSPLTEVPTPMSAVMPPAAPSSNLHGNQSYTSERRRELNPFDALPTSVSQASLAPPFSAVPIARFPPASPGAMSVPGSVGDSPASQRRTRQSLFDQEDAYGGI